MAPDDRKEAGADQERPRRRGRGEEVTPGPREEYVLRPAGGPFRIDYERELNPQQLAVVAAGPGPLLVIAGAGSGKTRALTYRVARLVESGVPPGAILLLTFTNKAAREMMHRAEALLGSAVSVAGGTFHHAGHLALRRHAGAVGLSRSFTIADRGDSSDLIGDVAADLFGKQDKRFPKGDILIDMVSMAANTGETLEKVVERKYPMHLELLPDLMKIASAYARRKEKLGIADFDDLLTLWLRAMEEDADVRGEFQRRFAYVLVDEYQDTNLLQAKIVDRVAGAHRNLMVVGDDAQSIYSFRGANFANIIRFQDRYPDAKIARLEINYRSSPQVLDLANASIAHNRVQFPKNLTTANPPGPLPQLVPLERPDEQAAFVAQRIQELEDEGLALNDIAVLHRSHFHSMEIQMELARRSIPFEVRSGVRFFEQAHVKDATAYLRIAVNPRDELAWKRVLRLFPKVGKVTADKVWKAVEGAADPVRALLGGKLAAPKAAAAALAGCRETMEAVGAQKDRPGMQLEAVLLTGYQQHLFDTYENAQARVQDLKTLAAFATKFQTSEAFLSELALMSNVAEVGDPDAGPPEQRIVLSSIHQAKGLEWTAVFVVWLVDGRFPDARALGEGGEEEERRLFYVAATRARRQLFLCYPVMAREGAFAGVMQRLSRFVAELPERLYTAVTVRRKGWADADSADRWMDGDSPWDE